MSIQGFNPVATTNAAGSFNITSEGFIQGEVMQDPAVRFALSGGLLGPNEVLPMWGGVGISETVKPVSASPPFPNPRLGGYITRATALDITVAGGLTGFSVFDQDHAMLTWPQNPVPIAMNGMLVNFYRLGSGARIPVAMASALVDLEGEIIGSQVSWDFNGQQLIPFVASYPANVLTGATWASTGGGQVTFTTTSAHGVAVGDYFTIAGMTPAGYNGDYIAIGGTAGSTLVADQPVNPGTETVFGTLVAGGGALPVRVLEVQIGNCMVVNYNSVTGNATWNRSGDCALILI